jgi:hypothetical protein
VREVIDRSEPTLDEIVAVGRGMATAVAPRGGLTDVQVSVLAALTHALTGVALDYRALEPLGPAELAAVLEHRELAYRQRIVHHMVLGELVLRPLPEDVARRVGEYAQALGIDDDFVGVARRYAQGAFGLAWVDLRRSGFTDRWDDAQLEGLHTKPAFDSPFDFVPADPELEARWEAFGELPEGTLGRSVWEMYRTRGFALPGNPKGASAFIAQHDFVHVLADCGTNLEGELETFALVGRADPDPKGFAWLATMVGLFETGYVHEQGFFQIDVRERSLEGTGMGVRLADALRRGKAVAEGFGRDLFTVDFHAVADWPLDEARAHIQLPPKSADAIAAGSPGVFDPKGMTARQREAMEALERGDDGAPTA